MMTFLSVNASGSTAVEGLATAGKPIHPTRLRLIVVAMRLFQQRGFHAVGLSEILALSETPKGSLYHHFPGGKSELAEACVLGIASSTIASIDKCSAKGIDIIGFLRDLGDETARWLEHTDWRDGSLLAVLGQEEGGSNSALAETVRIGYQRIEMRLAKWLMQEGITVARSREIAATILAAHEGALLLARSRRDTAPVTLVSDMLCALVDRG